MSAPQRPRPKRYSERRRAQPPRLLLGGRSAELAARLSAEGLEVLAVTTAAALHTELARPLLEASVRSFAAVVAGPECVSPEVLRLLHGARSRNARLQVVLAGRLAGPLAALAERLGLGVSPALAAAELASRLSVTLLRPHARRSTA